MNDISSVGSQLFSPHQGELMALADSTGAVILTVTLYKVEDKRGSTAPDAPRTAFTLNLSAPEPCAVQSGDYILVHASFGQIGPVRVERVFRGTLAADQATFQIHFN